MQQEVLLRQEARIFRKHQEWDGMFESGRPPLPEGTVVRLDPTQKTRLFWKGLRHDAIQVTVCDFSLCGDNYYLLVEEAGLSEYCS